ncbi:MAG: methyltransferase [Pseudorhodobacter sp.]|nr:methyltransferase [Pseudorhodobacter sp.]
MAEIADRAGFIAANLTLQPVAFVPETSIYMAHPGSRLSRLGDVPPYWAYVWAGGAGLARFVLDRDLVQGLVVLDFGAGSGLVGIAAAMQGARVFAEETDPWGRAAVGVNAAANGVVVSLGACQPELVLAGDVFYGRQVAARVLPVLDGFRAAGARVLVGDPGRVDLPRDRLELLAEIEVRDMGDGPGKTTSCGVFDYRP